MEYTAIVAALMFCAITFIVAVFFICRWIHSNFKVREMGIKAVYDAGKISQGFEEVRYLTDDMIKSINDQLAKTLSIDND